MAHLKPVQNRLLEELPRKVFKIVRRECELVELTEGDVLSEAGEPIRDVYFPTESLVSLVAKVAGDLCLEVALVGDEGMVGLPLLLGVETKPLRILVQRSGKAWRIKAETFKRVADTSPPLRRELGKYAFLRLEQVAQNASCARTHKIEARLARRLLMMQDGSHSAQFHATQESLASMLGVRRSTITCLATTIQQRKIIQYHRGSLTVLDRKGLEEISCKCYRAAPVHRTGCRSQQASRHDSGIAEARA
jgi:CRP-like cAMP-binding protein